MIRLNQPLDTDVGLTLIEVVVAVAILGIAFVAIIAGMGSSITASVVHRTQANASVVLASSAESIKAQEFDDCASTASYDPKLGVLIPEGWQDPPGPTLTVTDVKYWNGSSFDTTCPSPTEKLQLISIELTSPDGRDTENVSVVKRCQDDAVCPP